MTYSKYFFIGNKANPYFMLELNKQKHTIMVFKPDKYSQKMKDFFEKYYLGEILYEINYEKMFFIKNDATRFDKITDFDTTILSELLIKLKKTNKYILIKEQIYES
jgi:hypothetical protein